MKTLSVYHTCGFIGDSIFGAEINGSFLSFFVAKVLRFKSALFVRPAPLPTRQSLECICFHFLPLLGIPYKYKKCL